MRLLFMGSGRFAVPSLRSLLDASEHEVAGLITQPDKPAGRGHALRPPPTKSLAESAGLPLHQPVKVRSTEAVEIIGRLVPECIVVAAYGQIIPKSILEIPPKGVINVHGSLLPAYRGAAPIQWAIVRGERETGITTMLMDEGLDTGAILLQRRVSIAPDDTGATLEHRLAELGADVLIETLNLWKDDRIEPSPQDDTLATLAPRIKPDDAAIDWTQPAAVIERAVRGFNPWPVARAGVGGKMVKIWRATATELGPGSPGEVLSVSRDGVLVACGRGALRLIEIQAEGRQRMPAAEFARGQRLAPGSRFQP